VESSPGGGVWIHTWLLVMFLNVGFGEHLAAADM
jgi:hypothetical protein